MITLRPQDFAAAEPWDDVRFAAEMEARQFRALAIKLDKPKLVDELAELECLKNPRRARAADLRATEKWLKNGWNTERLLRLTNTFDDEALPAAIQWCYPMAYYSAYTVTCACFAAVGHTEKSHAGVIKKFGLLALKEEYPAMLCIAATGTKKNLALHGIAIPVHPDSSIGFDPYDAASVDKQICQFLKSTREQALEEKVPDFKFKTRLGRRKKRLDEEEWEKVSDAVGPTSILSLLYRKRIKAHYRDIDSFAHAEVDTRQLHRSLVNVVSCLNFTHETMIAAAVGRSVYEPLVVNFANKPGVGFLESRLDVIIEILPSSSQSAADQV